MAPKTARACIVACCRSTTGLHRFPEDPDVRRRWARGLSLRDGDVIPPSSGVCNKHFARDAFFNYTEFEMGFTKQLHLKSDAVPTAQPQPQALRRLEPKSKRDIGCQTDPVLTKYASVQADMKPTKRSKAVQAQAPSRSVSCYTGTFTEPSVPKNPSSSSAKRPRHEASAGDSSRRLDGNELTARLMNSFSEVAPWARDETSYVVEEEQLLELFCTCPVCERSCVVERASAGTLLRVSQRCGHCQFANEWCSQPPASGSPGGPAGPQICDDKQT